MFIRSGYSAHTRSSATEDHHLAARIVRGLGHVLMPPRSEPGGGALALEILDRELVEVDQVLLDRPLARQGHCLAPALEHEPARVGAHRDRLARVHDPVLLTQVWQ